ncbi:hypothetical protein Tco_0784383 [Tanacetum coccineum]
MAAGQSKPEVQWSADERKAANLDHRLKILIMFVLPDDQTNSIINCVTAKSTWDDLILCHEGPSDVKESRVMDLKLCYNTFKFKEESKLASLFGKIKYKENLIDSIYDNENKKDPTIVTPVSTAFISISIIRDFQDSPDDEEDTRNSQEYLNDLEEEYQTRALLANSKRFFKKVSQRFSSAKATEDTQSHKCGRNEDVSSDDNEVMEVKALMALVEEERVSVSKECARNGEWVQISIRKKRILGVGQLTEEPSSSGLKDLVFIKSLVDNTKASIPSVERPWLSDVEGFILPNHDTSKILPAEFQRNSTDPPVTVIDSSETEYDSADESSIWSTFFPLLKKPSDAETVSGPKAVKTPLKSISTFKAEALKGIIPNEPSSTPA